jgi:ribokinase
MGLGSLNYDYIYQVDSFATGDHQVIIDGESGQPGGSAANTIYALAKLGISTGFLGAVGADFEGEQILTHMHDSGIDTSRIRTYSGYGTSKVIIYVDSTGERAMYSLPGVNTIYRLSEEDLDQLNQSKFVIISAIPGKEQLEYIIEIVAQIYKNVNIVFMPGALYSKLGFDDLKEIIKKTHTIILNRRELKDISGYEYQEGAKWLLEKGCKNIAVTLSPEGSFITSSEMDLLVPTVKIPADKVIDSTGAGDAFTAGLVFGYLNQKPLNLAALYGNLLASACIQSLGARAGLINKDELEERFNKFSNKKEIL